MSHSEQKQSADCPVCLESFTSSVRARVSCPQCHLDVCRTCVRRYLLNTTQQAHCMGHNCKCTWDREFLIKNLFLSLAFAILLISIFMALMFRSFKMILISLTHLHFGSLVQILRYLEAIDDESVGHLLLIEYPFQIRKHSV